MFNFLFASSILALAGNAVAQEYSFYGQAYNSGEVTTTPCKCDNVPVGGAAFASSLRQELGRDLCCAKVTIGADGGQVQTVFNAICDDCSVHDVALEIEAWTSLTDQKEGPVPIFWTAKV
ncbi:uncharacterized protein SCHCODRAFT_01195633 [Schizophyllum commune H4-8]|nr:uncharacterized protein SCHCODRAFT_01195633 [Schizophyllum commune H4-8]KAI5894391.1 hypothetical protein SCHCODRAFT_01195633 [Schizophyllum commune H4-8]